MPRCGHKILLVILFFTLLFSSCNGRKRGAGRVAGMGSDGSQIEMLRRDGLRALNMADFDSAVIRGKQLLEIASENSGRTAATAAIYGNILLGQGYLFSDSMERSYPHLHEAENLCLKWENDSALASVYNGLGLYASNIENDFPGALRYFFLGVDAAKRSSNERLHSLLLVNIASIYALNNDAAGLRYALECYRHGKRYGDRFLIYTGAMTAAYSYALRQTDTPKALDYIREAEVILHTDSIRDGSSLYYIYGVLSQQAARRDEATEYFRESVEWMKRNREGDVRSYIGLAEMSLADRKGTEAVAMLDSALRVTDEGHSLMFRGDVLKALATTHEALGNASAAQRYRRMAIEEDKADDKAEKEQLIEHIKTRYDLERADNEVNRQRVELLEKERTVNLLIGLIAIALVLTGSFIYLYRRKSRLYSAIVKQTTEAAREESRLHATIRQLEDRIAAAESCQPSAEPDDGTVTAESYAETDVAEPSGLSDRTDPSAVAAAAKKPVQSQIPDRLVAAFERLMSDPAVYTDNLISKDKIAQMLDTNRTYVSRIVNEVYHKTFPQFINGLRIKEAVRRISDPECDIPLKALASELGYNSMTTFYTKFSEVTGMTPAAFREKARRV